MTRRETGSLKKRKQPKQYPAPSVPARPIAAHLHASLPSLSRLSPLLSYSVSFTPTVRERSPASPGHRCGFDGASCALIGHCGSARHPRSFFHAPHCDANDSRFHCGVGGRSCQSTRMRSRSTRPSSFVCVLFLPARLKRIKQ